MKGSKLIVTLLAAGVLFCGCGVKQNAAITINGHVITEQQFNKEFDRAVEGSPFAAMGGFKENPDGMLALMTRQRILNQMIIEELLNQESEERGIKVSNKEVDEAIMKIVEKVGGKDQLMSILKQNGVSVSEFKKDIKKQVKYRKLAQTVEKIEVTDKECEEFYKKHPEKFTNKEQVRASHILIMANPYEIEQDLRKGQDANKELSKEEIKELKAKVDAKMKEKKELADKIAKEVKADKENFANYAKKYSEDKASAAQGGDLGYFEKERMVPEFSNIAFSVKPETITNPVQSQFGYHIIYVTDRKAASKTPYEKAKENIREIIKSDKEIYALDDLTKAAQNKAKIEYSSDFYNPEAVEEKLKKQLGGLKDSVGVPDEMRNDKKGDKKSDKKPAKK